MKLLTIQAWIGLLLYDLIVKVRGFSGIHRVVEAHRTRPRVYSPSLIETVCNAVDEACVWYVRPAFCLQKAAVTTCLLRRHGIPAQLVIGAKAVPCITHAWVESDNRIVHGIHKRQDWFQPLYRF